jgi:F-type H+-transporting ATPase subunit gamma
MASQRDVRNRIDSVKNIQTITRAMEMVAAARLRRAEQRVVAMRPYADAIRRMTSEAAKAAGTVPSLPILVERETVTKVGLLAVAGDRGLAGAFNSQVVRAAVAAGSEYEADGKQMSYYAAGRRPASSLNFRGKHVVESFTGFSDRPAYADAREIAGKVIAAYVDGDVDRVELIYNHYVSPMTQVVTRETLLPIQQASLVEDESGDGGDGAGSAPRTGVEYEPDPDVILGRLVPDYVEISIYRALLDSTASEHGARMTAMRNATENAGVLIEDLTLQMNRARQAAITQEIMEVVAGAEGVS